MFDLSKRGQLEERFTKLEFTWYPTLLEIIPQWGNPRYLVQFQIHTTFLNNSQVESLVEVLDEAFTKMWDKKVIDRIVRLNDKTSESAKFIKILLKTKLDSEYKLLLAVSAVQAVKDLGLKRSLDLLKAINKQFGKVSLEGCLFTDEDLKGKDLVILPGVEHNSRSKRAVANEEISHFFSSEIGVQLSFFLAKSNLTFGEFFALPQKKFPIQDVRQFSTPDLLMALKIVENSPCEKLSKLTADQILSIVKEMPSDQIELYPMDEILGRPRRDDVKYRRMPEFKTLFLLQQFTEDFELEKLIEDAINFDLKARLETIPILLSAYGAVDPMYKDGNHLLPVLAEIAVTKGVYRYLEVIDTLNTFSLPRQNWFSMETAAKIRLIKLTREALDENNDEINFNWLLQLNGHLPFDHGGNNSLLFA